LGEVTNISRPIAFHHVSSVVTDLDRSVAFYSGLLGLEVRSRTRCEMGRLQVAGTGVEWPGSGDDWSTEPVEVVLLELGGVRIELAQPLNPGRARATGPGGDSLPSSSHVALKVSDVRELRRKLEAAGVRFLTPLLVFPEEGRRPWIWCRCEDPDGHQVELVEEMPASYQLERMAERLREARAQRELTLKEVAAQSSISAAHLSQVERGETVPSVPTLLAISSALGVSPDYFFRAMSESGLPSTPGTAPRSQPPHPVREATGNGGAHADDRPAYLDISGEVDWRWLTAPNASVRLASVRYEAGAAAETDGADASGNASCAVLEGTVLAEVGSTHNVLSPGSSISYDISAPHRFSNPGDVPAVGIWGFHTF
jgi:transcriptional regulator with XRE-family HTH domain/catechol 2,3-dioxygenase-like lactoylglutathione lyase family enzyme